VRPPRAVTDAGHAEALDTLLAGRYPQYRDKPFDRLLVLRIVDVIGWSGAGWSGRGAWEFKA
jgi:hypothetical protein